MWAGRPLPLPRRAVAVVAHPDDESFGLGALLSELADLGAEVSVVCLTHGEASTLGACDDLGVVRDGELMAASTALGLSGVVQLAYADGALGDVDPEALALAVEEHVTDADLLVVFEPGGVTGHADHQAATAAAERAAVRLGLAVMEWGVTPSVAQALREELGVPFRALEGCRDEMMDVTVDRARQREAIQCHSTQSTANRVLARRLALQGDVERVRLVSPDRRRS